jgi:ketol-acid reductoisomerase
MTVAVLGKDGFLQVHTASRATARGDVVCFAFPDHLHGRVFEAAVAPGLKPGATLWFLQGMSVHFRFVRPPGDCDVILIAPHAPGVTVREKYVSRGSFSAFYAVYQDVSGHARKTAIELAGAIGVPGQRLLSTTFEKEAVGDLFGEQAVLCGGLAALLKNGFEVLVENGIPPENAYLEAVYQLDLIVDLIKKYGIEGMFKRVSVAARFGSLLAGPHLIDHSVKKRMQKVFRDVTTGRFCRRLSKLSASDIAGLDKKLRTLSSPLFEKAARKFAQ